MYHWLYMQKAYLELSLSEVQYKFPNFSIIQQCLVRVRKVRFRFCLYVITWFIVNDSTWSSINSLVFDNNWGINWIQNGWFNQLWLSVHALKIVMDLVVYFKLRHSRKTFRSFFITIWHYQCVMFFQIGPCHRAPTVARGSSQQYIYSSGSDLKPIARRRGVYFSEHKHWLTIGL